MNVGSIVILVIISFLASIIGWALAKANVETDDEKFGDYIVTVITCMITIIIIIAIWTLTIG